MFTGPVGPVELCFYWLEVIWGNFLLAWGQQFTASVELWNNTRVEHIFSGQNATHHKVPYQLLLEERLYFAGAPGRPAVFLWCYRATWPCRCSSPAETSGVCCAPAGENSRPAASQTSWWPPSGRTERARAQTSAGPPAKQQREQEIMKGIHLYIYSKILVIWDTWS